MSFVQVAHSTSNISYSFDEAVSRKRVGALDVSASIPRYPIPRDAPQQSSLMRCGSKLAWPLWACMGTFLWRTRYPGDTQIPSDTLTWNILYDILLSKYVSPLNFIEHDLLYS